MREAGLMRLPDGISAGLARAGSAAPKSAEVSPESLAQIRLAAAALDHLPLAALVLDRRLRLHYWNREAAEMFGMRAAAETELPRLMAVLRAAGHGTPQQMERIVEFCGGIIGEKGRTEPGAWLRVSLSRQYRLAFKLHDLGGNRWLLSIENLVSAAMRAQLGSDAMLDALTGLSNRRGCNDMLRNLTTGDEPDSHPAALIIDLDCFNTVNDGLGQAAGDSLLCLVAQRLQREVREGDLVARLGGDEFAILQTDGQYPQALAARVVDSLSRPFLVEGHVISIGGSVGVARFPDHGATADELMRHADLALYEAKSAGRGTWRMFDPMLAEAARGRRELETDLRRALTLGELSLVYQRQIDVVTGALTGFAAQPCWTHPTRGTVPADVFMPVAEAMGCAVELAEWILRTACQEAARWPHRLPVAVNMLPRQLADGERLAEKVQSALHASGLPPNRLEIEVSEGIILKQEPTVLEGLRTLRRLGIGIIMDNFATGYSPSGRLAACPLDKIKIDQALVSALRSDGEAGAMSRAIIALGASAGTMVIALGCDFPEQAAQSAAKDGEEIQGPQLAAGQNYITATQRPSAAALP